LLFERGHQSLVYGLYDPHGGDSLVYEPLVRFMDLAGAENRIRALPVSKASKRFLDFLGVRYIAFSHGDTVGVAGLEKVLEDNSADVYRNEAAFARAFTVNKIVPAASGDDALAAIGNPGFDLAKTATVEGAGNLTQRKLVSGSVVLTSYEPEKATLSVDCPSSCFVVMTDTNYPGWKAYLDGEETRLYKADVAFRGVYVPQAGGHELVLKYDPCVFKVS
jgi:hypothetical protein